MDRDFKGVWIPKGIYLNKDLSWSEKILIIEIDSLDNSEDKGCFASNKYLAEFIGISESAMANMISKLKSKEFIYQVFFDGRNRGLRLHKNVKSELLEQNTSIHKNMNSEPTIIVKQSSQKSEHNNTVNKPIINLVDNIESDILKIDIKPEKKEKEKTHKGGGVDLSEFPKEFISIWDLWKTYKKEKCKFTFLNADSEKRAIKELLNMAKDDISQCEKIINQSIDNGWKGLFEIKKTESNGTAKNTTQQHYNKTGVWNAEATALDAIAILRHRRAEANF